MRLLLHPVLAAVSLWVIAAGCTTKDSLLHSSPAGFGGAQGGAGAGKGGSAGSDAATAGVSTSGDGGRAGNATAGAGIGGGAGNESAGNGAEGGDGERGGSSGMGASEGGFGGTEAGAGGGATAGAAGSTSCPSGEMWCPGCTVGSGMCAAECPGAACTPCDSVDSLAECEMRTDCHSVFENPQGCDCPLPGCCARFERCADNERADCTGASLNCEAVTPYCEHPAYVVSYSGICYEGCVAPKDCAPSPPTPCPESVPVDGSVCGGDSQCYYDACPSGGRAIAICSGRVWSVDTGTVCAVECAGFGAQCGDGEICLVHAGGAVQIECIPNGCGTGPVLPDCAGNCQVSFSLDGGATAICNTCPQGGCP